MTKSSLSNRRFIQTSILNSPQLFFVSLFWKSYNLSLYQFLLFFLSFLIFGSHRTNRYKLPITTCISSWITFLWFHEFQTCDQGNGSCFHECHTAIISYWFHLLTKDLTSSSKFSGSCVLTLQTIRDQ